MKLINFDTHFQEYIKQWMVANKSKYASIDDMEAQMPDVYLRWLNEAADWLDGDCPGVYFDRFLDPEELVAWMKEYMQSGVPVPDQLLDRIGGMGDEAIGPLIALLEDETAEQEAKMTAIGLLREIDTTAPMDLYLNWLGRADEMDELLENAVESLKNMGTRVLEPCLALTEGQSPQMRECMADILADFPGDGRILAFLLELFEETEHKALVASYLGKYGDEQALPTLTQALDDQSLNYLDYIEIANAVQSLGGEVTKEREFAGDPYYESMKQM